MTRGVILALLLVAAGVFASFCVVVIDQREIAFRTLLDSADLAFNRPVLDEPGLYVSIPGLHKIYRYERRAQIYDARPRELQLTQNYKLNVDYYLIYRVVNPRLLRETAKTQGAISRLLDDSSFSQVRRVLGLHAFEELLSDKRDEITRAVAAATNKDLISKGIEVLDFRISRTDHPAANREGIFRRMRTEREAVAKRYRAEGDEAARKISSDADRQSAILRAKGEREALRLKGEGDAEAARIYADAYSQDGEFYRFVRSLEAYRTALDSETTLILSPDSQFLKYLFDVAAPPPTP